MWRLNYNIIINYIWDILWQCEQKCKSTFWLIIWQNVANKIMEQKSLWLGNFFWWPSGHGKLSFNFINCRKVARGGRVYSSKGLTCEEEVGAGEEEVEAWYHGETSRTLYTRQREHLTGKERATPYLNTSSFTILPPNLSLNSSQRSSSKSRWGWVSINLSSSTQGYLMNSKSEYKQGEVARVVVERGLRE